MIWRWVFWISGAKPDGESGEIRDGAGADSSGPSSPAVVDSSASPIPSVTVSSDGSTKDGEQVEKSPNEAKSADANGESAADTKASQRPEAIDSEVWRQSSNEKNKIM